ncbi:hypothetical protein LshimejAT787_0209710 [Lyophyllum shimeji]|uniref:B-related factor 1 n=1 Tax=Lyophyllum shimeji TaxID=47721 RepID=A0A9P3PGH4_LYOSH|nr:hypothetical protein LshimejAT787_0209710 [Lyophyllum shimeji]
MTAPCKDCGGPTAWDDDAGTVICTQCGTLADPAQSLLTNEVVSNLASQATGLWDGTAATTLKSLRAQGTSWDLTGQGKEARDRRNSLAMAQFISSLAVSINAPGLSPRATIIFNQAMAAGKFRWGRKAKLVAGASLAVALREYRRPDSLSDIAYLLDEQCPTLVRTLTAIISLLNISLTPVDPSIHIPALFDYLTSVVTRDPLQPQPQSTTQLPAALVSQLKSISLRAASNTATALSTLLARLGPDHTLNSLPTPPTAVALFLLGLEAEARTPLSQLGDLAQCLGARCHKTSRGIVMARYKLVQDEVASWIEQVPWLGQYEQHTSGKRSRAKVGKRSIVARGIPDVLQFQDEIWRGKLRPAVVLDMNGEEEDKEDLFVPEIATTVNTTAITRTASEPPARPSKRPRLANHPLRDATQFLLNPLAAPLPTCESPPQPIARSRSQPHSQVRLPVAELPPSSSPFQNNAHHALPAIPQGLHAPVQVPQAPSQARPASLSPGPAPPPAPVSARLPSRPSLPSYILTAPSVSALRSAAPPTRLQLLTASRGAADDISDEELFAEGELEGMIRPPEEAQEVEARLVGLGILPGVEEEEEERRERGRRMGGGKEAREEAARKGRVDLEALARFLKDPEAQGGEGDGEKEDRDGGDAYDAVMLGLERFSDKDENEDGHLLDYGGEEQEEDRGRGGNWGSASRYKRAPKTPPRTSEASRNADGMEMVVDEWRPLSPEAGLRYAHAGRTRIRVNTICLWAWSDYALCCAIMFPV